MARARHARPWIPSAGLSLVGVLVAFPAASLERLHRRFGLEQGLSFSEVTGLAQDSRGFIWIATFGGLYRYDGVEMRPWPRGPFRPAVTAIAVGPGGDVVARDYQGRLLRIEDDGLVPLAGPPVAAGTIFDCPIFDAAGDLWTVTRGDGLWTRSRDAVWRRLPRDRLAGETPRCARASPDGTLLAITDKGLWRIGAAGAPKRLLAHEGIASALLQVDGSVVALLSDGTVLRSAGQAAERLASAGRPIDIVAREQAIWVSA